MRSSVPLIVFFDAECGFCCRCAAALERLDRANRLRLVPLQSAATALSDAPPTASLLETMHVVDGSGRWETGAEAWLRIASVVPALRPLAFIGRLPLFRSGAGRLYDLVSRNRGRLGRLVGAKSCTYPEPGR